MQRRSGIFNVMSKRLSVLFALFLLVGSPLFQSATSLVDEQAACEESSDSRAEITEEAGDDAHTACGLPMLEEARAVPFFSEHLTKIPQPPSYPPLIPPDGLAV